MEVRELGVPGAWLFVPPVFPDARGAFAAPFRAGVFAETMGHSLHVAQTNTSVSRRGALRGIHFADVPPGQAKYVQCSAGAVLDVVVDVRVGSPTFGTWDAVRLDGESLQAVYVAEGLGHAFLALTEGTVTTYLCSREYAPAAEHGLCPLDPALDLPWTTWIPRDELVRSDKDAAAPTLEEARAAGTLPTWAACRARYEALTDPASSPTIPSATSSAARRSRP